MGEHAHNQTSALPTMEAVTHWLAAPLTQVIYTLNIKKAFLTQYHLLN